MSHLTNLYLLDKALEYANNCVSDNEITTWEVKRQCEIFLNDYNERQYRDDFDYYFDESKVKIIENLLKLFNFPTGFRAGEPILTNLAGFQCLILVNLFGWRTKGDPDKFRYRDVTLFIVRKVGKTFLNAIILMLLMLTEQNYSEFYSICLDRELAGLVKQMMSQIIDASPFLHKYFKMTKTLQSKNVCTLTKSFYQPRTSESSKNNSIRPNCVLVDECGAFTDNSNIQAMRSGQRSVKNPIMVQISTAYECSDSILKAELEYDRSVLKGTVQNERLFCLLYYGHEDNKWSDTELFRANPLRQQEDIAEIKADRERCRDKVDEQGEFFTKNLNIWYETNSDKKYVDISYWKKCCVDKVDFAGKEVVVGVDLSMVNDLTSVSIMYVEDGYVYCKSHGFLPEESLPKRKEKVDYRRFAELGYCTLCKGMTVDYGVVEDYIRSIESTYDCSIKIIVSDPYNALAMMSSLGDDYNVLLLRQTYTNLSPATKEFRKQVLDGKVRYEKNLLLDWCMSCATTSVGKSDDEMLNKQNKQKERIDLVATLIFCYTQLMVEDNYDGVDDFEAFADMFS